MIHKDFLQKVGIEIKVARIRKGLSTMEVSELTGLHRATIQDIEGGRVESKILTYKRIADSLGVEMRDFM